jgi:NB-ARC domain
MSGKLKLLLLAANSVDTVDSRADDEIRAIGRAIQVAPLGHKCDVQKEPAIKVSDIGPLLLRHNPDVLHISCHSRKTEGLMLENDLGRVTKIQCAQLKDVLFSAGSKLRLVTFGFCHSADCARQASTQIDFVLGINREIPVKSSLIFMPAFYEALVSDKSIEEAIDYGKSIMGLKSKSHARAIVLHVRDGADPTTSLIGTSARAVELKSILQRVVTGAGGELDRMNLRKAIEDGVLVLSDPNTEDMNQRTGISVGLAEYSGILHASFGHEAYRKLRETVYPIPPGIAPPLPPSIFVGRVDALQDIKRLVAIKEKSEHRKNITVIRGWPGVGKTSVVSAIGHDSEIARTFKDGVLWISLEQKPNIISEMARWGRALGSDEILKAPTVKEATAQLAALLSRRRMFLIVDDVWETGHATAFTDAAGEQCSVMITTRVTQVAEDLTIDQNEPYNLPVLTEEFALKLLRILVPEVVSQNENQCLELVKDLECLPLALHVAAGLLRSEAKLGWGVAELIKKIREGTELMNKQAPRDRINKDGDIPSVKALLQRSTDVLDDQTRDYFTYLGAFAPRPATFDLAALSGVWRVDDPKPTVRQLVAHGLLEPVGRGRFQMHRILVDHARSLCED